MSEEFSAYDMSSEFDFDDEYQGTTGESQIQPYRFEPVSILPNTTPAAATPVNGRSRNVERCHC